MLVFDVAVTGFSDYLKARGKDFFNLVYKNGLLSYICDLDF